MLAFTMRACTCYRNESGTHDHAGIFMRTIEYFLETFLQNSPKLFFTIKFLYSANDYTFCSNDNSVAITIINALSKCVLRQCNISC